MCYYIGVDLGGTNIKVGVTDENFNIIGHTSIKTPPGGTGEAITDAIVEAINLACECAGKRLSDIDEIGIGTPGAVDSETGTVLYSNNLGFRNFPLAATLREKTGKTFRTANDANAAAYGEVLAGAGRGCKDVIVVTLGTGVGSGIIIGGKIYEGFNHCAGELGHTVIEYEGVECSCGRKGCFEAYCSATALKRMTREAMAKNKSSVMWKTATLLEDVTGKTAFDGMRAGDHAAINVVTDYISYLGCGLTNIINTFQPELLLIGGGICKEGDHILIPLRKYIADESYKAGGKNVTRLDVAKLGNDAGIIGAAFLHRLAAAP